MQGVQLEVIINKPHQKQSTHFCVYRHTPLRTNVYIQTNAIVTYIHGRVCICVRDYVIKQVPFSYFQEG